MRKTGSNEPAVHTEGDQELTPLAAGRQDGAADLSSGHAENMADEEKPKEEPKQDSNKPVKNGGYTIPVQMY